MIPHPNDNIPHIYIYKRIVQAKLFMDEHYGEAIDLGQVSDEACFSKFHFIRLFSKIYGFTPHQYLVKLRIEKAKLLLQKGLPVNEVCMMVGFNSITSFPGLFRKVCGQSPSSYQLKFMKREAEIKAAPLQFIPNCFAEQNGWK